MRISLKRFGALATAVAACLLLAAPALAAPPPGPPYANPVNGQRVYDYAGIFSEGAVASAESLIDSIEARTGVQIAVYTQVKPQSDTLDEANADARALMDQWGVGRKGYNDGLVILFDMEDNLIHGQVSLYAGAGFMAAYLSDDELQAVFDNEMLPLLKIQEFDGALIAALVNVSSATVRATFTPAPSPTATTPAPPPGPPYPNPVNGRRVYDYAGIFSAETIASAEATIDDIEDRTGAQVTVYTQVKPQSDTLEEADQDALDLMNQWGVGRKGFDDGLVILFDMETNLIHGQVSLYAGEGYKAAFLSNDERQALFDDGMLPLLRMGDMDGALLAAMETIDGAATPEHAALLERARQVNALIVVAAVMVGSVLLLIAFGRWFIRGRDPFFLDDPSIYLPAPPAGLTPAMATLLMSQRTSERTVAAALVDLAACGLVAFRQEKEGDTGIKYLGNGAPSGPPEGRLAESIRRNADSEDYLAPGSMYEISDAVDRFKDEVEKAAVKEGWLVEAPSAVKLRWRSIGITELSLAGICGFFWFIFPVSFLFALTASLAIAGFGTLFLAFVMPARTRQGAALKVMLEAYRRSLLAALQQSKSMEEVVKARPLPWVETPDQAMAWGVAMGLNDELEALLARSQMAGRTSRSRKALAAGAIAGSSVAWAPSWWTSSAASSGSGSGASHAGSLSPGLFSSSPFPDPGAIFAALGSLASPPSPPSSGGSSWSSSSGGSSGGSSWSSSSGGSSGGFGGGGSSGGGGAGGGF